MTHTLATKFLTYEEAAVALRIEERWLRRNIRQLPHSKRGRTVTFTPADIERIDRLTHYEPTSGPLAAAPASLSTDAPHPLASLKPLPARVRASR